jgi:hypothetical protein
MLQYDVSKIITKKTDDLTRYLRANDKYKNGGIKSFQATISQSIKSFGKKWLATQIYEKGDIISFNGSLYIAREYNIGKDPLKFPIFWQAQSIPFASNIGKVKAALVCDTNGNIIKSFNIKAVAVDKYYMTLYITFQKNIGDTFCMPILAVPEIPELSQSTAYFKAFCPASSGTGINISVFQVMTNFNTRIDKSKFKEHLTISMIIYANSITEI